MHRTSEKNQPGQPGRTTPTIDPARERGMVLIWALLTTFIIVGIVLSASDRVAAVDSLAAFQFAAHGQSEEVAQAGLVDALAWYRRQSSQPVTNFQPKGLPPSLRAFDQQPPAYKLPPGLQDGLPGGAKAGTLPNGQLRKLSARVGEIDMTEDLEAEMAAAGYYSVDEIETEVPELGLVRSFVMAPGVWARYTVTRGQPGEPFSDANANGVYDQGEFFTDTNEDGRWTPVSDTIDVSAERGMGASGTTWYLTSLGEVFERPRLDLALGEGPNVRLARSLWGTEIRRLTVSPPASAALCAVRASAVSLGSRTRVTGDTAVACAQGTGSVNKSSAEFQGSVVSLPEFDASPVAVFGVEWSELMSMADISTTDPVNGIPKSLPTNGLIVITGDSQFSKARPMSGTAIVAVKGDVILDGGSNPYFSGVLYVDGDLTVRGPALLKGTTIVTGRVDIRGGGGDYVELEYDGSIVGRLLQSIGQYRHSKSPFRIRERDAGH